VFPYRLAADGTRNVGFLVGDKSDRRETDVLFGEFTTVGIVNGREIIKASHLISNVS
jgi:hypothetical protein